MVQDLGQVIFSPIKEVHIDGTQGTVLFDKGICVQWGYAVIPGTGAEWDKISLNRPFKNTNYNVQTTSYYRQDSHNTYLGVFRTDGFDISTDAPSKDQQGVYWLAIGEV